MSGDVIGVGGFLLGVAFILAGAGFALFLVGSMARDVVGRRRIRARIDAAVGDSPRGTTAAGRDEPLAADEVRGRRFYQWVGPGLAHAEGLQLGIVIWVGLSVVGLIYLFLS
jgi:hypothetical protein